MSDEIKNEMIFEDLDISKMWNKIKINIFYRNLKKFAFNFFFSYLNNL